MDEPRSHFTETSDANVFAASTVATPAQPSAAELEAADDRCNNPSTAPHFQAVRATWLNRRQALGLGLTSLVGALLPRHIHAAAPEGRLAFMPVSWNSDDAIHLPDGYRWQQLASWGDPLLPGAKPFNFEQQTPADQAQQFGFNNDYLGFCPLPAQSDTSDHGLLCVSFEYTDPAMMYPDLIRGTPWSRKHIELDLAAHGMGVVEVRRDADGHWSLVADSTYNRRITGTTPIQLAGPAAGHALLQTPADPAGTTVLGTLNNCAGGITAWGTWLQAEENFNQYFAISNPRALPIEQLRAYGRYGVRAGRSRGYNQADQRFDLSQHHNEANRFGWIVEVNPYQPDQPAVKRTALGRFKHEAATVQVAQSGHPVVYMGDDQADEYVYKFVAAHTVSSDPATNWELLNNGVLYVARFNDDGSGAWLPLVHGEGPLTAANGFPDQASILINTRQAADLLGATPMDRPEDVEPSPTTGKIYLALTNNSGRQQGNAANPRAPNYDGHIIELTEAANDHTGTKFSWEIVLLAGPKSRQPWYGGHQDASPLSCPDNLGFLNDGTLVIATDGQIKTVQANDGIYFVPTSGPHRGRAKQFMSGIPGGEICGPCLTPDNTTMFCAIQHPGADNPGRRNTCLDPGSRFPDYQDDLPPRPTIIAIQKRDGKRIGT
jgi:secreted PhoX family phosphatase